jgi:Na+/melibiose symporter-like transporter
LFSQTPQKILFALGLGTAFSLFGDTTMYAVLPTHTAEAGITLVMVGILLGVNRAVRLVFNGVAGWCYDRDVAAWAISGRFDAGGCFNCLLCGGA